MILYLDDRDGSKDLEPELKKLGAEVKVGRYPASDIWFWGVGPGGDALKIGIERKIIHTGDLTDSIGTGRLMAKQWPKLRKFDRVYLLVEGITRTRNADGFVEYMNPKRRGGEWHTLMQHNKPVLASSLSGFLSSVQEFTSMRVIKTGRAEETARECVSLYRWWSKEYEDHSAHTAMYNRSISVGQDDGFVDFFNGNHPFPIVFLVQIDGVGVKRAKALRPLLGSVENMLWMSKAELQKIAGKLTGERIYNKLREK